jgi:hypothetical protein
MNEKTSKTYKEYDPLNWNDRYDVLRAVEGNGMLLVKASNHLKKDKDICLKAIEQFPLALGYADDSIRNDLDCAKLACSKDFWAYKYVGASLLANPEIVEIVFPKYQIYFSLEIPVEKKDRAEILKNCFQLKEETTSQPENG